VHLLGDAGLYSISQSEEARSYGCHVCEKKWQCWMCSKENGNKIMKSGERLQGAKREKRGTGAVDIQLVSRLINCNRLGLVICYNCCDFQEMRKDIVGCHDTTYRMDCVQRYASTRKYLQK
jgi:predicted metal-binding protein